MRTERAMNGKPTLLAVVSTLLIIGSSAVLFSDVSRNAFAAPAVQAPQMTYSLQAPAYYGAASPTVGSVLPGDVAFFPEPFPAAQVATASVSVHLR